MACLEHQCNDCGYYWSDNNPSRVCPECGSTNTIRIFDEPYD